MPQSGTTTLTAKGKQGKPVSFADISFDLGLTGTAAGLFQPSDQFDSYSYGLKGKTSDYTIQGTAANEYLTTGDGNDTIYMQGGDDIVVAGGGDDFIHAGTGNNIIDGGDGIDSYVMASGYGNDVDLTTGTMTDSGGTVIDVLLNIENVYGNNLDNIIIGDDNDNFIITGAGADTVYGGGGNDTIEAGGTHGAKTLYGQDGDDTINGGLDDDFIFGGEGADIITGNSGNDTINLAETVALRDQVLWGSGDGMDTINSFDTSADADVGGDLLVLDLVGDQSGSTVQDLVDAGYLRFSDVLNGVTMIQVDADGGGDGYENAIVFGDIAYDLGGGTVALFEGNIVDSDFLLV